MSKSKSVETTVNVELGNVLRTKHPRWTEEITVEQTGTLSESRGLRPDIIIRHFGGIPVVVETEYFPGNSVERDALQRLGKSLEEGGETIEQTIAVLFPKYLSKVKQHVLKEEIEKATFQFCVFSYETTDSDDSKNSDDQKKWKRWPEKWLVGGRCG